MRIGSSVGGPGRDLLVTFDPIDFDDNLSKAHTQHRHSCKGKKSGGRGVHFLVIYRFYNHKGCILIIFLVPLSNIMCLFTHVRS